LSHALRKNKEKKSSRIENGETRLLPLSTEDHAHQPRISRVLLCPCTLLDVFIVMIIRRRWRPTKLQPRTLNPKLKPLNMATNGMHQASSTKHQPRPALPLRDWG